MRSSRLMRAVVVVVALLGSAAGYLAWELPSSGPLRIEAAPDVRGVRGGFAYAWIVRTARGAMLIDAGAEQDGRAILDELARLGLGAGDVHSVLVTHGHGDHIAAAALFPNATVYVHRADAPVLRGETHYGLFRPDVKPPARIALLGDGEMLNLDGELIRVVPVPGHTPGSVVYLRGAMLFTGDSLMARDDGLAMGPWFFSESQEENLASLERLLGLEFDTVADGHTGLTRNAAVKLRTFIVNAQRR